MPDDGSCDRPRRFRSGDRTRGLQYHADADANANANETGNDGARRRWRGQTDVHGDESPGDGRSGDATCC